MIGYLKSIVFILMLITYSLSDVVDLKGNAEFRSVMLKWKYRRDLPDVTSFVITFCEDQAWGKYRCRNKLLNPDAFNSILGSDRDLTYEAMITGLRMATNYTVEVNPVFRDPTRSNLQRARALGSNLLIQTKGFSARAINCLTDESLVEIETGPFFGGKISVEGSTDPGCSTHGNALSRKTSYQLSINHDLCGSKMNTSSVKSYIIVQENLPILTHSTRRFMVVCNYLPATFTVRAGVNLPDYVDHSENELIPVDKDVFEVDPAELFDSANNLFSSRMNRKAGRALRFSSDSKKEEPQKWAHMVLMVILVMAALVGVTCAVGHIIRSSKFMNRNGFMSPQEEPSALEINTNMEAVMQDLPEDLSCSMNRIVPGESPSTCTLTNFDSLSDRVTILCPEEGKNYLGNDRVIADLVLDDLHPLDFERDDPLTLTTIRDQPLLTGPSNLLEHQTLLNDSTMQIFSSPSNYTCANVVPVPYPLISGPNLVNNFGDVGPTIVLPDRDLHIPHPDIFEDDTSLEDDFKSNFDRENLHAPCTINLTHQSDESIISQDDLIVTKFSNENDEKNSNNIQKSRTNSKESSVTSIEGIDNNWQLKDQLCLAYPATAV